MEYKELVEGVRIPVLGLGTWGVGGYQTPDTSRDEEEVAALRAGIELGMTHIDTAETYGAGHSEVLVGEAIKPYKRGDLFITTKVWRTNLRYDDLISAMKGSLKRLGVEYVDLYLIHWPNPEVPLRETMRALEYCAEEGYTRFIGVSNFSASLLAEAQSHLRSHRLVADQVHYSLLEQSQAMELLPYCHEKDVMLIAYKPLGTQSYPVAYKPLVKPGHPVLDELAEKYGKTQAQVSLNWLVLQEKVVAIPKASRLEHLRENVGAVGWRLSHEDFVRLGESFR